MIDWEPTMTFQSWLDHYDQHIKPIRVEADNGDDSKYSEYDEAYNVHLEALHAKIADAAPKLDAVDELLNALQKIFAN